MTTDAQMHADDERARDWLRSRLQWEGILGAMRETGAGSEPMPAPRRQEPAAA